MRNHRERIIFSDVDGTLLDSHQGTKVPVRSLQHPPAADRVVLISSRTLAELRAFTGTMGVELDLIGEDGGFIATRQVQLANVLQRGGGRVTTGRTMYVVALADGYSVTLGRVREILASTHSRARVASALTARAFADETGEGEYAAQRALTRRFSILLDGIEDATIAALATAGFEVALGGRWTSVIAGSNKGRAMCRYCQAWESAFGQRPVAIAVGDAPNDASMLRAADRAFVIRDPTRGHARELADIPRAELLHRPGPLGWQEMLSRLETEGAAHG